MKHGCHFISKSTRQICILNQIENKFVIWILNNYYKTGITIKKLKLVTSYDVMIISN